MPLQQSLNGRLGLGEVDPRVPDLHNRRESPKLIVDLVREHPNEVRILTFGPLTNVAMAFDLDPDLPLLLNGVICLGGVMRNPATSHPRQNSISGPIHRPPAQSCGLRLERS